MQILRCVASDTFLFKEVMGVPQDTVPIILN